MKFKTGKTRVIRAVWAAVLLVAIGEYSGPHVRAWIAYAFGADTANADAVKTAALSPDPSERAPRDPLNAQSVELSQTQLAALKIEPVEKHVFPIEKSAVGSIDFNQEMSLQVFTPYQGRILTLLAKVGDEVKKGQTLFTIDSPDLLQAESTLISAAGVAGLTVRNLARLRQLYEVRAIAQKDMEQASSDQQAAEGALKAARDVVRIFGKSEAEIDRMIAERKVDPTLVVPSPISGRITARNAAPGLFVQPGNPPAPYSIADLSTVWMIANVAESDSPAFRVGQDVRAKVMAFPDRVFEGQISTIGATVDPNTHRVLVRSELKDPNHELRPGMFANFVIRTGDPVSALAIPFDGVVREGDGTMTAWITNDRHRFNRRTVKIGLQRHGFYQILEGVNLGDMVATEGALFLSNALSTSVR
jgi:cobalt-zinc-cadmium efflux system membrane fusion protein